MAEHIGLEGNEDDTIYPNIVVADDNTESSSESGSSKRKDPPIEAENGSRPPIKKARLEAKVAQANDYELAKEMAEYATEKINYFILLRLKISTNR